jgi:hypothetical protein
LDPNAVEDAMNDAGERRIFTRVNVSDQKLELKFLNENQFAKQYIENISVGGLLVKTKYKPKLGSFIPVEFSIGQINSTPKIIKLRAKVCRVTGDSIGLEFPDLNRDNRKVVEKFVRSALAPGSSAARQVKKSTLEHLEQMREKKLNRQKLQRKLAPRIAAIVLLLGLNIWLVKPVVEHAIAPKVAVGGEISIDGKIVSLQNIRSIRIGSDGKLDIELTEGIVSLSLEDAERIFPDHLKQSVRLLQSIPPLEKERQSKTSRGLTRLR